VPIYEFRCEACGERFEALVDVGTGSVECRLCGAADAMRVLSAQAAPPAHVKSPAATRAQERRNAQLRERTKADLAATRRRLRERQKGGPG
jgi:putative FmdB family regulatory protein